MIKEKYVTTNPCFLDWAPKLEGCVNNHNYVYYIKWCNGILYACIDIVIMVSPVCHTPSQSASIIHSNIVQLQATRRNTSLQHSSHRFIPQHLMRFTFQSIIIFNEK